MLNFLNINQIFKDICNLKVNFSITINILLHHFIDFAKEQTEKSEVQCY